MPSYVLMVVQYTIRFLSQACQGTNIKRQYICISMPAQWHNGTQMSDPMCACVFTKPLAMNMLTGKEGSVCVIRMHAFVCQYHLFTGSLKVSFCACL